MIHSYWIDVQYIMMNKVSTFHYAVDIQERPYKHWFDVVK